MRSIAIKARPLRSDLVVKFEQTSVVWGKFEMRRPEKAGERVQRPTVIDDWPKIPGVALMERVRA